MTWRVVLRALLARPVRSAVLAGGFGFGISVMAILLGVGEVVLEQARSPELEGGGDALIRGMSGQVPSARFVLSTLQGERFRQHVDVASPSIGSVLYLQDGDGPLAVTARGGIPSLERRLGDSETAGQTAWQDGPRDASWTAPAPADVLRALDRFHPVPDAPRWAGSWAEWLYFNGTREDTDFYLTFLVGDREADGARRAGVRLQLLRGGRSATYSEFTTIAEEEVRRAPDLSIGASSVRLEGLHYRIRLDLRRQIEGSIESGRVRYAADPRARVRGEVTLDATESGSLLPITLFGAHGWLSGYVVPVLSGKLGGSLTAEGEQVSLEGMRGYHDHNWGFWEGVSWQWGQVAGDDLSFVYGRVFPPQEAADPERMRGFLGVMGREGEGPLGFSSAVTIQETEDAARRRPSRIEVRARAPGMDLTLDIQVLDEIRTGAVGPGAAAGGLDFLQLRGRFHVTGTLREREIDFTAQGKAETFRTR